MEDSEFAIVNEWLGETNSIEMFSLDLIDMITSRQILRNIVEHFSETDDEFSNEDFWNHVGSGDLDNARCLMEDTFSKFIEKKIHEGYEKGLNKAIEIGEDVLEGE